MMGLGVLSQGDYSCCIRSLVHALHPACAPSERSAYVHFEFGEAGSNMATVRVVSASACFKVPFENGMACGVTRRWV